MSEDVLPLGLGVKSVGTGARITIAGNIYHQHPGEDPTSITLNNSYSLKTEEEPYNQRIKIGGKKLPLLSKRCWVEEVGLVVIRNLTGTLPRVTNPSPEELETERKQVLELHIGSEPLLAFAEIPPGETLLFKPSNPKDVWISCLVGSTYYRIYVFPK